MRRQRWTIEPVAKSGPYRILLDRRFQRSAATLDAAIEHVRAHREPDSKVYLVAEDGYSEDITRTVGRRRSKHWRQAPG